MGAARNILEQKRDDILRLAAMHGARHVRIFGSAARGEDREDSDIDLLVEMEANRSLLDRIGFAEDVEALIGRRVDVATDDGLHRLIREQVIKEALPL